MKNLKQNYKSLITKKVILNPHNLEVDLLSDKEFDTLLDAASKDISSTQDINEDEFDK